MKLVDAALPQKPNKEEKKQKLKDLEIRDCFRFFDGVSLEDAKKTADHSFFFVTAPNGPKPGEDKVPCLTFDMKQYRHMDGDRMVIKHDVNVAILPAAMIDIPVVQYIEGEVD